MEEKKDILTETKRLLAEIMQEDDIDGLYEKDELHETENVTLSETKD